MQIESLLGLLGLARRAGKLAAGEALTAELVQQGRARAIFIAQDIGEATRRKVMRHDERVPVFMLPCDKSLLGRSIGVDGCAVCAVQDMGMAAAAADKLVGTSSENDRAAQRVRDKKTQIDSRKGFKKDQAVKKNKRSGGAMPRL